MPTTMQGFLLVAGTAMFIVSFFTNELTVKGYKIPRLGKSGRIAIRSLGIVFLAVSGILYYLVIVQGEAVIPLRGNAPEFDRPTAPLNPEELPQRFDNQ